MSNYVNNLNELINTKKELKDIIIESTGENPSEVFSYYPSYIRSAIASGSGSASEETINSYISAYLSAYNYIDQDTLSSNSYITMGDVSACGYLTSHQDLSSYATKSYVVDYVATYAPTPDLSSYVSKTELSNQSYLTSIPSEYITQTELSNCGYITMNDITIPVIDESIIPNTTSTYTLGDSSHIYNATYTNVAYLTTNHKLYGVSSSQVNLEVGSKRYVFSTASLFAAENTSLGKSDRYWKNAYISNLYTYTAYLQDTSYSSSIVPKEDATYTLGDANHIYRYAYIQTLRGLGTGFNLMLGTEPKYDFYGSSFRPRTNGNINLGGDQNKWGATYTANLYADTAYISNYNNLIWTGTSAEYASLDNYTTYQIYMIKEA